MRNLFVLALIVASYNGSAQGKPAFASSTLSFPVSDLKQSIDWYQQLLGEVEGFSPAEGVFEFQLNESTWLQLFEGEPSSGAILRLEVKDIQDHHSRLVKLGISPGPVDMVPNVVSYFDFKDPDGNLLSFYMLETP